MLANGDSRVLLDNACCQFEPDSADYVEVSLVQMMKSINYPFKARIAGARLADDY